jgi:hypothetical protein
MQPVVLTECLCYKATDCSMNPIIIISLIIITLFSVSCRQPDTDLICNVQDPAENLPWLAEKVDELESMSDSFLSYWYISRSVYNGEPVFILGSCCPFCTVLTEVFDCQGNSIGFIEAGDNQIPASVANSARVVWKPADFQCNF